MSSSKLNRIAVMTGATAGLGAHAVKHIAAQSGTRVIIGARGSGRIGPVGTEIVPLDLASLSSVRAFADEVKQRLGSAQIDMLVLNAGMQYSNADRRSIDGFELTFAVNHLSHYLLARLLLPTMAKGGRLIITTSDTHDPALFPLAPRTLDPQALAHPGKSSRGVGLRRYAASKLCNLLTARSLAALDEVKARNITVIAYNPGLTGGTELARAQPWVARMIMSSTMRPLVLLIGTFLRQLYMGTPERAGEALAELTLGTITPPSGRVYASLVRGKITFPDPSKLAQNDEARDRLWRESAIMVGVEV